MSKSLNPTLELADCLSGPALWWVWAGGPAKVSNCAIEPILQWGGGGGRVDTLNARHFERPPPLPTPLSKKIFTIHKTYSYFPLSLEYNTGYIQMGNRL